MPLKTRPYDSAEYLETEEDFADYLALAAESGDPQELAHALGVVARARGISDVARQTGLSRQAIYKALSGEGNPEFATIMKVADVLGYRVAFVGKNADPVELPLSKAS
ncbi:MAG: putative addiction module antidote protein [Rhizobiaceae bacterium]|uniref:addiction module antidote protein n=1 Tax=Martelella sp. TaxID=1969699 RepID=UPI000C9665EB|nr:putative addiction module antidote protein [Rhizobiaceae bacterium]|tara:strand:- start:1498 stop:1821 length:324 start_codon:yes stop_codon:yes gene_type:complete